MNTSECHLYYDVRFANSNFVTQYKGMFMNSYSSIAIISSSILLFGCGGGDDGGSSGDSSSTQTYASGKVADGYLSGALVCLDKNSNLVCDSDEPSATTNDDGAYTLSVSPSEASQYSVIAIITPDVMDADTDDYVPNAYTLVSPPGKFEFVSPITTLLSMYTQDYSDESLQSSAAVLKEKLGVDEDIDLFSDFIAAKQSYGDDSDHGKVHRVAQLTARMLGQHLKEFNDDVANGTVDENELLVATDDIIANLVDLSELADSEDFDADAIAEANAEQWNANIENLTDLETYADTVRQKQALAKAISGGVYQYIELDGDKTDNLIIRLTSSLNDFEDNFTVSVSGDSGFSHTFTNEERMIDDLDFDGQVAYHVELDGDTLAAATYTFSIVSTSDAELTTDILEDTYQVPALTAYDDDLIPSEGLAWFEVSDYTIISYPTENDTTYYQNKLFDDTDALIDTSGFRLGKSQWWFDDLELMNSADSIMVLDSDGATHQERNFIREAFVADLSESDALSHIDFNRTYTRTRNRASDDIRVQNVFQFNVIDAAAENNSTFTPYLKSVEVEFFDGSGFVPVTFGSSTSVTLDFTNTLIDYGDEQEVSSEYWDLWHSIEYHGFHNTPYLDAFYSSDVDNETVANGIYRYVATDINDEKSYSYDYYESSSNNIGSLERNSFTASVINNDWYELAVTPSEDSTGNVIYEFQVYVWFEEDEETEDKYLFNLGKHRLNKALLSREKLKERVLEFEEEYETTVDDITIDVSIYDGDKGYNVDERFELIDLDLLSALENVTDLDDLLN